MITRRKKNNARFSTETCSGVTPYEIEEWLFSSSDNDNDNMAAAKEAFRELPASDRRIIVLYIHNPNVSQVARDTGLPLRPLYRKIRKVISIFKNVRDDGIHINIKRKKQC